VLVPEGALFDIAGSKAVNIVMAENKVALRRVVTDGSFRVGASLPKVWEAGKLLSSRAAPNDIRDSG
jgi:hypothetical protein